MALTAPASMALASAPSIPRHRIDEVVGACATRAPGSLAVSAPDGRLSYADLDRRATELARTYADLGVGAGSIVALALPRSAALIAAALGAWKVGATYLALDVTAPARRQRDLLVDSGAAIVATAPELAPEMGVAAGDVSPLGALGVYRLAGGPAAVVPADVAYVCYTSGSTGGPKGVLVGHDGLANLTAWHCDAFEVGPADRCSQVASPGFDAFAWEVWPCLAAGAALHVLPEQLKTDPRGLRDWLVAEAITVAFLPTPLAEAVLGLDWPAETALRVLLTGGDRLSALPRPGLPFVFVNNYGVTEATVVSTSGPVAPQAGTAAPPIGRPIRDVRVAVVDAEQAPVAEGEPGELLVGGVSVALGYLGSPELTAERFFIDATGERWYRTGDLVRARADGELEFVGRADDQVSIRGFRVEPNEIVNVLGRHPAVAQSVVVTRNDEAGERTLVAYCVSADGADRPTQSELREHLGQQLPAYMLPAALQWLDQLPVTTNGKVDRDALPWPLPASDTGSADRPATDVEAAVASIVATLLGREVVGLDENFILLGGHSLLAAQLVVRLEDRFGVQLPLRTAFERPTVAEIADEVLRLLVTEIESLSDEEATRLLDPSGDS